jgi:hypothetical protein
MNTELNSLYDKLIEDDTALTNANARRYIKLAIDIINNQNKFFVLFGSLSILLNLIFLVFMFRISSEPRNIIINKITNRKVTVNRIVTPMPVSVVVPKKSPNKKLPLPTPEAPKITLKEKMGQKNFIAKKISLLNPRADAEYIAAIIVSMSDKEKVDPLLVASIIKQESNFNKTAKSSAGALGLMQILPSTARYIHEHIDNSKLFDVNYNVTLGVRYYKQLLLIFNNDHHFSLIAYNWGPVHLGEALLHKRKIFGPAVQYAKNIKFNHSAWEREYAAQRRET